MATHPDMMSNREHWVQHHSRRAGRLHRRGVDRRGVGRAGVVEGDLRPVEQLHRADRGVQRQRHFGRDRGADRRAVV